MAQKKDGNFETSSLLFKSQGLKDDFTNFKTFGCRVWVRPPGERRSCWRKHAKEGIFLGFSPRTTRNILWYNPLRSKVSIAKHARFDEGFSNVPLEILPLNVIHLNKAGKKPYPADQKETSPEEFQFFLHPFAEHIKATIKHHKNCKDEL